jgi:hypothetical protein
MPKIVKPKAPPKPKLSAKELKEKREQAAAKGKVTKAKNKLVIFLNLSELFHYVSLFLRVFPLELSAVKFAKCI